MRITLTAHARQRSLLRGASIEMIREAIDEPDGVGVGYQNRQLATRRFEGRGTLRVVYAGGRTEALVITVIWE